MHRCRSAIWMTVWHCNASALTPDVTQSVVYLTWHVCYCMHGDIIKRVLHTSTPSAIKAPVGTAASAWVHTITGRISHAYDCPCTWSQTHNCACWLSTLHMTQWSCLVHTLGTIAWQWQLRDHVGLGHMHWNSHICWWLSTHHHVWFYLHLEALPPAGAWRISSLAAWCEYNKVMCWQCKQS